MAAPKAERTRARLLNAAVEAFAERGFHGTSTRHITDAARLSSAALYVHHGSKEDLLFEISEAGHKETLAIVRDAAASSDDPIQQLRALMHGYVLFHVHKNTMARVINYEMAALSAKHYAVITSIRREIDQVVQDVITAGITEGVFHPRNPRMTAVALESMGIDIARWYRPGGAWQPEQIASGYVEMVMRMVDASPGRGPRDGRQARVPGAQARSR